MRIPSTLVVLTPLVLLSCDAQEELPLDDRPPAVGEELEDVGQELGNLGEPDAGEAVAEELGESLQAMGDAITGEDHRTFSEQAAEAIDDLEREIDARLEELEGRTDIAAEQARKTLTVTKGDIRELRTSLERLDPTEDDWEEAAEDIRETMREIADSLDREA